MIKLILIRHPQTNWNKTERYLGRTDIGLNQKGKKQARAIGRYLKKEKITAIYSSDLSRALTLAALLAKQHGLASKKDKRLREIDFGFWEGLTFSQIQKKYPVIVKKYLNNPLKTTIPGAESFLNFKKRVSRIFGEILKAKKGTVVVVSHGGVNRLIICRLGCLPASYFLRIKQDLGAINIFEIYERTNIISKINQIVWEN